MKNGCSNIRFIARFKKLCMFVCTLVRHGLGTVLVCHIWCTSQCTNTGTSRSGDSPHVPYKVHIAMYQYWYITVWGQSSCAIYGAHRNVPIPVRRGLGTVLECHIWCTSQCTNTGTSQSGDSPRVPYMVHVPVKVLI